MDRATLDQMLAAAYGGHAYVVVSEVAAGTGAVVDRLRDAGGVPIAVVAATPGIGDLPDDIDVIYTGSSGDSLVGGIRSFIRSVEAPSDETMSAVDALDPDRSALVVGGTFATTPDWLGRRIYGPRRPEWAALEDKMIIDDLWDAAGVDRSPSKIVPVADAAATHVQLRSALGSVWVADNSEGWHGGGEYVRWVQTRSDVAEATDWFARHATLVRVMPFLDGIPCSIHGFVTDTDVATFRPVEMVILREVGARRLRYSGPSTFWDPPLAERERMRDVARRVAEHLSDTVRYRGGFSIDGIMTENGFRPTELNPRLSAGLIAQARSADLPLVHITRPLVENDIDIPASWIEEQIVPLADATRYARMFVLLGGEAEPAKLCFEWDGLELIESTREDPAVSVAVGSGPAGALVATLLNSESIPHGPSVAPIAAAVLQTVSERFGLDLPTYAPAPDVLSSGTS